MGILTGHHRPNQRISTATKMFKILSKTWILLLTLALISTLAPTGKQNFVNAEDELEDEIDAEDADEEVPVEDINVAEEEVKTEDYDDDLKLDSSPNLLEVLLTYQLAKWLNSWLDSPTRVTKICLLNQWKLHSTTPWIILLLFKTSLPFNMANLSSLCSRLL